MCSPPAIMAGLAIGSSLMGVHATNQQAKATQKGLDRQAQAQQEEIESQASTQMGERVKQARRERARIRVAAGESGVQGASFEAQLADSFGQQNQDLALINKNARFAIRASDARYQSASASINRPTYLGSALQIGAAGYGTYYQGREVESLRNLSLQGG